MKIYFSDFFDVDEDIIEGYGAVNISLINDLPLFIDPCCLTVVTNNFRKYMRKLSSIFFLQEQASLHPSLSEGMMNCGIFFPK